MNKSHVMLYIGSPGEEVGVVPEDAVVPDECVGENKLQR